MCGDFLAGHGLLQTHARFRVASHCGERIVIRVEVLEFVGAGELVAIDHDRKSNLAHCQERSIRVIPEESKCGCVGLILVPPPGSQPGAAHWIGHQAVRAVLKASDQEEQILASPLAIALFRAWGVASLLDLARAGNSIPPPDFAALFPAVANSTDELSRQVLRSAGRELAQAASVVMSRLFGSDKDTIVPVAMVGGVFRHAELVRQVFYNELRRLDARADVKKQVVEPVEGALQMARRAAAQT